MDLTKSPLAVKLLAAIGAIVVLGARRAVLGDRSLQQFEQLVVFLLFAKDDLDIDEIDACEVPGTDIARSFGG